MFYYLKDKNNKIVCFNNNKDIVKNTMPFLKHIQNFTEKDIIETKDEMISRYNKESKEMEFVFLKDVETEFIREEKDRKIEELKKVNQEHILLKYSIETQIDIVAGIETQLSIDDMRLWIGTSINVYNTVLMKLNSCRTVKDIRAFDVKQTYENYLQNKYLKSINKLPTEAICDVLNREAVLPIFKRNK